MSQHPTGHDADEDDGIGPYVMVVLVAVVLAVALGVRALPDEWRRGPVRGLALAGLVVGLAGYPVLALLTLALAGGVVAAAARAAQLSGARP
jgi:hypothetical protein